MCTKTPETESKTWKNAVQRQSTEEGERGSLQGGDMSQVLKNEENVKKITKMYWQGC